MKNGKKNHATNHQAKLIREHKALDKLIDTIRPLLRLANAGRLTDKERKQFAKRILNLRDMLRKHFYYEEHNGFLKVVVERDPMLADWATVIRDEHRKIMETLNAAANTIDRTEDADKSESLKLDAVYQKIGHVLNLLAAHESREVELLQSVFYNEFGAPGD